MHCNYCGKVKVTEDASLTLIKNIEKVTKETAPQKQSWTAEHAFKHAMYKKQFKTLFNADWEQKPNMEKQSEGVHLQAHIKFMHQKFNDLSPEDKAHYEQEVKVLNDAQEAEQSKF